MVLQSLGFETQLYRHDRLILQVEDAICNECINTNCKKSKYIKDKREGAQSSNVAQIKCE